MALVSIQVPSAHSFLTPASAAGASGALGPGYPASGPRWAHVRLWPGLCTSHIAAPVLSTRNVKIDDLKTVDFELVGFLKYLIKWFEGRPR